MRYFWWAEFQRRGAIHYHLMLVDAPFANEAEAKRWVTNAWTSADGNVLAEIQAWTKIRSARWFRESGADYVMKDARKGHRKAYEQDYTRMPRNWRTFRSNQLVFAAAEHQVHETKAWTVCTAPADVPWYEKKDHIWVERVDHHCPQNGGCRLYQRRARRRPATKPLSTNVLQDKYARKIPGNVYERLEAGRTSNPGSPPGHAGAQDTAPGSGAYPTGATERMTGPQNNEMPRVRTAASQRHLPSLGSRPQEGASRG